MTNSHKFPQFKFEKYVPSDKRSGISFRLKSLVKHKFSRIAIGMIAGAIVGLLYWKLVGCQSGTCPLTSNPYKSVILFSFMGVLMARNKSEARAEAK